MASRDAEVRQVVTELDALLDDLAVNAAALTAILAGRDQQQEEAPA